MLNNISKIEVKIADRVYQLLCDNDSPLGQVHDALSSMKGFIINKMQEAEKASQPEKEEDQSNGDRRIE
jgi:hypothetical protein